MEALKQRDELKISVLRLIKTGITNIEKQAGLPAQAGKLADDDDVISVINREIKQRQDTIAQLASSRPELIAKDTAAIKILKKYLPEQLSETELQKIIDQAISQTGASSLQDIGKVMALAMAKAKGRADGQTVSQLVRQKLAAND